MQHPYLPLALLTAALLTAAGAPLTGSPPRASTADRVLELLDPAQAEAFAAAVGA